MCIHDWKRTNVLPKEILAKSEALESELGEKLDKKIENNERGEINAIKRDFEVYKLLNYEKTSQ